MGSVDSSGPSSWNPDRPQDNVQHSDSSDSDDDDDDDDEETVPVETESGDTLTQFNYEFARKISTNKRLDKSRCLKEGYLQILRSTSFHKWRRRYFWLKGKTLFYGKNKQALIYEEIDIAQASVAEYTLKNVNHAFQVIAKFGNFVLATDSRKEMESWIQSIIHASQQKYYDRNDQQSMILGLHSWYIASHARPIHCNVCKEALPGVLSRGLSCGVCRFKSHKRCAVRAPNNCKWSTLASVGSNIIENSDGTLDTGHQWIVGNLPVGTNNNCAVCEKKCGSIWKLVDERCLWCKAIVHTACKDRFSLKCYKTICQFSVLCPISIQSIDSDGLCRATKCRGSVTSPLLVFVNSKSGDKQGVKFLRKFKQLLNPAQVFDLMNGGPFPGLRLFQNYDHFRILICGGDGSIGWVMSEMDHLNLHHKCQVGVLPLGTGNDLARVLGWGAVMSDDNQVTSVIDKLEQSQIKMLDRWSVQTYEWKKPRFRLPSDEETEESISVSPSADSLLQQDNSSVKKKNETTPEDSSMQSTYESTIAVCLHKILNSNDYLTVINYSKSLCEIVNRFLDKLLSLGQLGNTTGNEKAEPNGSPLGQKCEILQRKLNRLVEALNETKVLADEEESRKESSSQSVDNQSQPSTQATNPLTPEVETSENTEILMSRANSVKKAIKQIMDHTEAAMNLTICPNMMSLVELKPIVQSPSDQKPDTPFPDSGANKPETASNKGKIPNKPTSQTQPYVSFAVRGAEKDSSTDAPIAPPPDLLSASRKISAVSMFRDSTESATSGFTASSAQSAVRPSTSLRVKNAIANKREGCGSFISKMLLANADAICAPVIPPIDDQAFLSAFEEKAVMNNYFGIGLDAKINYEFQEQREHHPERFRSRARNFMTFASLGGKEIYQRSCRNFEKRIRLECDGQQLPLPELQGIVILNIPSYSGGTNFWGTHNSGSSEPFTAPSFDDKIIEVMAVKGSAHIGASRFINIDYHRIAQCRSVKLTILGNEPVPVQVDGEAWLQNPGFIKITHKNRAQMLTRDRSFEHTLKSWSERQSKEKLAMNSANSPETQARRFSAEESRMHDLVQATHELIDCLSVMNLGNTARSNVALSKCGEFITLDDATRAGLHELSVCSTELCSEVQELLDSHSGVSPTSANETDDSIARLRSALHQTQSKLENFSSRSNHSPPPQHKHRHGPFSIIGRLIGRHKRSSTSRNHSGPSTAENIINQWSTEDVGSWLGNIGLGEYSHLFIKNDIRGSELMQLQQQDFKDLGITKVGHIKRIQSALKSYSLGKDPPV